VPAEPASVFPAADRRRQRWLLLAAVFVVLFFGSALTVMRLVDRNQSWVVHALLALTLSVAFIWMRMMDFYPASRLHGNTPLLDPVTAIPPTHRRSYRPELKGPPDEAK
jgi:hypothetical protein